MLERDMWKAADTSAPAYIDLDLGCGLIVNGDFETGDAAGWLLINQNGAASSLNISAATHYQGSYGAIIAITNPGAYPGDIQLKSSGAFSVVEGRRYTLTFAAHAGAQRDIIVAVLKGTSPWTSYGLSGAAGTVTLDTFDQFFSIDFTATATAMDAKLFLFLGGNPNDIALDVVGLYEHDACRADYLAVMGHNLGTLNAAVTLQYSDNSTYTGDVNAVVLNDYLGKDTVYLKTFTDPGPHRYWRLRISEAQGGAAFASAPQATILSFGLETELDYASAGFDPYEEEIKANVTRSDTGYVLGVHNRYRERRTTLTFEDADDALYQKIKDWWDNHGLQNFFVAWERGNNPDDVFLMMPEPRFTNPFKLTGRRDITISLTGRRE